MQKNSFLFILIFYCCQFSFAQGSFSFLNETTLDKQLLSESRNKEESYLLIEENDSSLTLLKSNPITDNKSLLRNFKYYHSGAIFYDTIQSKLYALICNDTTFSIFQGEGIDTSFQLIYSGNLDSIYRINTLYTKDGISFWAVGITSHQGFALKVNINEGKQIVRYTKSYLLDAYRSFQVLGNRIFLSKRANYVNDQFLKVGMHIDICNDTLGIIKTIEIMADSNTLPPKLYYPFSNDISLNGQLLYMQTICENDIDHQFITTIALDSNGNEKMRCIQSMDSLIVYRFFQQSTFWKAGYLYSVIKANPLFGGFEQFYINQFDPIKKISKQELLFTNTNEELVSTNTNFQSNITSITLHLSGFSPGSMVRYYKYNFPLGKNEIANSTHLSIYPIPCNNQFTIERSKPGLMKIEIYDVLGNKVVELETLKFIEIINVNELKEGIYNVRCLIGNESQKAKLIISR